MRQIIFIIFLLASLPFQVYSQNQDSVEGDYQALMDLYNSTDGDNWSNNSGWGGQPSTMGDWYGIQVNSKGRVVSIKLNGNENLGENGTIGGNGMKGTLPESLGNLKYLWYLNVKHNELYGEVPWDGLSEIDSSLTHLFLNGSFNELNEETLGYHPGKEYNETWRTNNFSGEIKPSIGNLTELIWFELNGRTEENHVGISGAVPYEIGNLTKLKALQLSFNSITDFPSSMSNLVEMEHLSFARQNGALDGFTNLKFLESYTKLKTLWIENNKYSIEFPDISKNTNLRILALNRSRLIGEFPFDYLFDGTMPYINMVEIAGNHWTGTLPEFSEYPIGNNLGALIITGVAASPEKMTGPIPDSFFEISRIINTNFSYQGFTGSVKQDLTHLHNIRNLRWSHNNLSGPWPTLDWDDTSKLSSFRRVAFNNNRYVFSDMLYIPDGQSKTIFDLYNDFGLDSFSYDNQVFGKADTVYVVLNGVFEYEFDEVTHKDNIYQWKKDGQSLQGHKSRRIVIEDISSLDEGVYQLEVTNPGVPGLVIPSEKITLKIGDDSGSGNNGKGPQKSTPAKGDDKVSKKPTFKWNKVEEAETYELEVLDAETQELLIDEIVADTSYTPGKEFQPNQKYQWRVRGITINGELGEWGDTWEFMTTDEELAFGVEVEQNYPNPFNPSTNIRFNLAEQQEISLKVYDMAGRLVATLINSEMLGGGPHSARFDASNLASGIYFYRIITPGEIVTRKMTLMK